MKSVNFAGASTLYKTPDIVNVDMRDENMYIVKYAQASFESSSIDATCKSSFCLLWCMNELGFFEFCRTQNVLYGIVLQNSEQNSELFDSSAELLIIILNTYVNSMYSFL